MKDKLSKEEISKDKYFSQISKLSEQMIEDHGKEFTMGALVMAAQWIAKNQELTPQKDTSH